MGPVVLRPLLATSSRPTERRGPSHRPAILDPRNDEGRLGLPRAAFPGSSDPYGQAATVTM
jgi:hypothetical protein